MKKAYFFISLMISLISSSLSQDYIQLRAITDEILKLGLNPYEVKEYKEIAGTPYLNPYLLEGKIITTEDKILTGKLRYNIYTDEIEFEYKNSVMSFAKPENLKEFYVEKQKLLFVNYIDGKKIKKGFMLITLEGNYTLMTKKTVVFKEKDEPQPYSIPKPDRFEQLEDAYYLSSPDKIVHRLISLKRLIKAFPELESIVKNYNSKVDFDNVDELKKLVEYINANTANH